MQNEHVRLSERLAARSREGEILQTQLNGYDAQDAQWHSQITRLEQEKADAAEQLAVKQAAMANQDETLASLRDKRGETQQAVYAAEKAIEVEGLKLDPVSHRITAQGEPVDYLYILMDGEVAVSGTWKDREATLTVLRPNATFIFPAFNMHNNRLSTF